MNWSRDKNFSEEKAVHGEIYCMLSFGGGSLNNELESWQELFSRESCEWGGEIETMNWSRDKNSSEEKTVHREILLHVGLGGELNNELDSKQELFGRESCEWKNLLHVQLWGGKFKQ